MSNKHAYAAEAEQVVRQPVAGHPNVGQLIVGHVAVG